MTAASRKANWKSVSKDRPCPVCGKADWCSVSTDGTAAACRRQAAGCWKAKTDRNGANVYIHRLACEGLNSAVMPSLPSANGRPRPPAADPDSLNRVYTALLGELRLSRVHQQALASRGFKDSTAGPATLGYRSLGRFRRARLALALRVRFGEVVLSVPGFVIKAGDDGPYITLAASAGLLIPCRDVEGRIVALKVRRDEPRDGPKYLYISSSNHGGPGPGAPVHVPIGIKGPVQAVRLTEGELKADLATLLSGIPTISVPGSGNWQQCLAVLAYLQAKIIRLSFDSDARRNHRVAQDLHACHAALTKEGYTVELERWHEEHKGIDDALAAGVPVEVLGGADAAAEIEGIAEAAKAALPPQPCRVNEAPDDPHRLARLYLDSRCHHEEGSILSYWEGEFLRWIGGAYRPLPGAELRAELTRVIKAEMDRVNLAALQAHSEGKGGEDPPTVRKVTARLVSDAAHALASLTLIPGSVKAPAWLDGIAPFPASEVLAAQNALVHLLSLVTGRPCLIRPTPQFFSRNVLDYPFDADAARPEAWLGFLNELWPRDPQTVGALQEWMGYFLTLDTSQQKILMLVGPKRSGKGTIARVIRETIGPENIAGPTLSSLGTNFGLWPLIGKAVAMIQDARLSGRTDVATVVERLLSISGEDSLTIDRKNLQPVTMPLSVRFMILTNELPRLNDPSGALAGRLIVLRLTRSWYGKEDTGLTAKLVMERQGILLWAIEGWDRLMRRGHFIQPDSGAELQREMEDLASPIGLFVREHCKVGPEYLVPVQELFGRWKSWCTEKGRDHPGDEATFGRNLRAVVPGLGITQPRTDDGRIRVYEGVGLR